MKKLYLLYLLSCLSYLAPAQKNTDAPLLQAIQANDLPQVKALVATGADVNTRDENKATALMWAAYKGDLEMVQYLVTQEADYTKKGVIYLNEEKTAYYGNLTGIAAGEGKLELLKYLIDELGIDVDDKEYNPEEDAETGWTALQWAVEEIFERIAIFLIEKGANYQLSFNNNWTMLHYAARDNLLALTQLLLTKNVDVNIQSTQGWTPLMLAAYNGYLQMCKLLYENGAVLNIKDEEAKTAYDKARENGYKLLAAYLNDTSIDISGTPWKELNDSVALYYQKGDYGKSLDFAERAYQRAQKEFSETHASYGTSLNNLALLYESMGRYSEAEDLYKEALQNADKPLG